MDTATRRTALGSLAGLGLAGGLTLVSGDARKHKKKKRKQGAPPAQPAAPLSPLGFAAAVVAGVGVSGDLQDFVWGLQGQATEPVSVNTANFEIQVSLPVGADTATVRGQLILEAQKAAALGLKDLGQDFPPDRIAVVLL